MERHSEISEEHQERMDLRKICPNCMKQRSGTAGPCEFCGYDPSVRGQAEDTLEPGSLLAGRYLTGRVLGRGGFGITYLGMDLQLQVRVAVKELFLRSVTLRERESGQVLAAGGKESLFASCRGRFLREARVLAMLDEKDAEGIVTVRDYFEENGTAYIVMEYIEGMTLREKIGREGRMDYREMMACIRPFCHAVIKIHSFNVVHKDISPENIMITPEGRVRLLDFGVACGPDPDPEGVPVSYKQGFAAPEQYSRGGSIRPSTDVYAAAAVVYYCLTGHRPVPAPDRQMGQPLRPVREWGSHIPKGAERAINKAMSLRQADRFQTMEDFLGELEKYEGGRPGFLLSAALLSLILLLAAVGVRTGILSVPGFLRQQTEIPEQADSGTGRTVSEMDGDGLAPTGLPAAEDTPPAKAGIEEGPDTGKTDTDMAFTDKAADMASTDKVADIASSGKTADMASTGKTAGMASTNKTADMALTGMSAPDMSDAGDVPAFGRTVPESMPVDDLAGTVTLASANDTAVMVSVSQDSSLEEPELIVWTRVWDETQQFRFELETDAETGYKIYPVCGQTEGEGRKCLELDRDTGQVLVRQESDSPDQLFRVIRARQDRFLLQASDGGVLGYSLHPDGTADGCGIRVRNYEEFRDPSFAEWTIEAVPSE